MRFLVNSLRIAATAAAFLLLAALGNPASAATLYGTAYNGPDGLATLYTINPGSGAAIPVGPIGFQRVSGIDFGPDGRLYGAGERNDGSDTPVLIVIDTATGAGTEIGPLGLAAGANITDISFRPSDGALYGYQDFPDTIVTINPATGATTVLGAPGPVGGGNGIAFSVGNVLFLADSFGPTTLFRVDQNTGAATAVMGVAYVGFPPPNGAYRINAMDVEPSSGLMYGSVNDGTSNFLATVDKASAVTTMIGPSVADLDALAWQPDRCPVSLYGASHSGPLGASTLHRIDPDTGSATAIGPVGFNAVGGMDFHPTTKVLYAVAKRPAGSTDVLIKIDPATGIGTEVGPLINAGKGPNGGGAFDLSFRSDGRLFLTAQNSSNVFKLFIVDLLSGVANEVGNTGVFGGGNALGFSLGDTLYQATTLLPNDTLYVMSQATGAAAASVTISYFGFPPPTFNYVSNAMDIEPSTGVPFMAVNDGLGGTGANYLGTLDVRTGVLSMIGATVTGLDALAWRSDCDDADPCTIDECVRCQEVALFGAAYTGQNGLATLYRINPGNGAAAAVGPIGFERVSGIDFDPLSGVLFGTGERADGSNTNVLLTIDSTTGVGAEVGPTGISGLGFETEPDISFRNSDGALYAYLDLNDGVGRINIASGAASFVGSSGVSGFGNGMTFSGSDLLYLADGTNLDTLNQSTGAATVIAPLTYVGFPALSTPRVNAMDVDCSGIAYAVVRDNNGQTFLATVDLVTGVVRHIGATVAGLDALAWRTAHGFCRFNGGDNDGDGVCNGLDCAPSDGSAFAIPPEVTGIAYAADKTTFSWASLALAAGSGTLYDVIADLISLLPVGPGGGESSACGFGGTSIGTGPVTVGAPYWLVVRGHNACGAGPYGNTHTNPGPALNGPQRTTTTCP